MSTPRCGTCKRNYWRYDGLWRGYCSFTCWFGRKRRRVPTSSAREYWEVMQEMREHRLDVHGSSDLVVWYDCEKCEEIEAKMAALLNA